jgi:hypothetical protein
MVAKDTSYGSETYRPYLDIERIINVQSAGSVNRGHDHKTKAKEINLSILDVREENVFIFQLLMYSLNQ